jgi:hypothetical protein
VDEEEAEERALFRTAEREYLPAPDGLKRPEDPKLEIRMPLRTSMVWRRPREERPRVRLLGVSVPFSRRFLVGAIVVACPFPGASIPSAGRYFSGSSSRSSSSRAHMRTSFRAS